jgi:hypothetical protein
MARVTLPDFTVIWPKANCAVVTTLAAGVA